jgi:DNA-binding NtrC family response regulator
VGTSEHAAAAGRRGVADSAPEPDDLSALLDQVEQAIKDKEPEAEEQAGTGPPAALVLAADRPKMSERVATFEWTCEST